MALGAPRANILQMVLGAGAKLLGMGAVVGLIGSLALTRFLKTIIWGVSPFDIVSFIAVFTILAVIGLVACARPALRASRVDPMTALRYE
jgi:putative ABC transport system permease protein